MANFLVYWRPETAKSEIGAVLNHAASNQLKRVKLGDTLWVTTVDEGQLLLLGRIEVGEVVGQRAAEQVIGRLLWEADLHVLAKPGTEMTAVRIPIGDVAPKLRFSGGADRLTIRAGKVNAQELQTMRRLEPQSARVLASKLGVLTNTISRLQIGAVYSRKTLRQLFGVTDATIKNGVFEPKDHNSIWLFITEKKTADRTQYLDLLDGDTLHFDGQTEGRTDLALINHIADGRDVLLFYRKKKSEYADYGFRFEGAFRYVKHERHRPTHFTFVRESVSNVEEVVETIDRLSGRRTSQGISVPPKVRIAIDQFAMKKAISYFESDGYTVEDVHTRESVDLIVRREGKVRRVEVKGTQTGGEEVLLTPGEVRYARLHKPEMMLFILSELVIVDDGKGPIRVEGGTVDLHDWDIDTGLLQALAYKYRPV